MSTSPAYRYSVDKCDVLDQANLVAYRAKRTEWEALLDHDPQHSVSRQLSGLLWEDAAYRVFNEMRRLVPTGQKSFMTAGLLAEALDSGYVQSMILGISRLTDPQPIDAGRGVVSLRRVFDDIRTHRHLITREAYICYDGLRFDPSMIPYPWERGVSAGEVSAVVLGGPLDRDTPDYLHERFDLLGGVSAAHRGRFDRIGDAVFSEINALLAASSVNKVRSLRNKFVAHAADSKSRPPSSIAGFELSMAEVETALRSLCRAYSRVQTELLWGNGGGLMPFAAFDVLDGLVETLPVAQQQEIEAFWEKVANDRRHWHEAPVKPPNVRPKTSGHRRGQDA